MATNIFERKQKQGLLYININIQDPDKKCQTIRGPCPTCKMFRMRRVRARVFSGGAHARPMIPSKKVPQNVPVSDPRISQNIEAGEQKLAWFCGSAHGLSETSLFAFIRCVVVEKKIIARVMVVRVFFGALQDPGLATGSACL